MSIDLLFFTAMKNLYCLDNLNIGIDIGLLSKSIITKNNVVYITICSKTKDIII